MVGSTDGGEKAKARTRKTVKPFVRSTDSITKSNERNVRR